MSGVMVKSIVPAVVDEAHLTLGADVLGRLLVEVNAVERGARVLVQVLLERQELPPATSVREVE
jgi:hypothetical protein